MAYPNFELNTAEGATAVEFSPDGSILYIATEKQAVVSINSAGYNTPNWSQDVPDSDLCDIALSSDGLSVRRKRVFFFFAHTYTLLLLRQATAAAHSVNPATLDLPSMEPTTPCQNPPSTGCAVRNDTMLYKIRSYRQTAVRSLAESNVQYLHHIVTEY